MLKNKPQPNYLDMVPVRNVQEFTEEEEKITLLIPKFKSAWLRKWLIPARRSKYFRIHLDTMGSNVWRLIDGHRNTAEICNLLKNNVNQDADTENQLELRVTNFLSQLYKNRFIVFS
jgi:hypothetical protein